MNDRIGLKQDSAETEASATLTEASAEASAESLPRKWSKLRKNWVFYQKFVKPNKAYIWLMY